MDYCFLCEPLALQTVISKKVFLSKECQQSEGQQQMLFKVIIRNLEKNSFHNY